jgi:hypothetical protein
LIEGIGDRQIFWGAIGLAALLRIFAAQSFTVGWFDEIWQYLEPAWHLVEGPWVQTWDYRSGIRSWLIPELLALPMGAGHALSPETTFHLTLVRLTLAALSLVLVGASTVLGLQLSRLHGAMAGFVTAIWFELIFFAPRALSEPIALAPLMGAVPFQWAVESVRINIVENRAAAYGLSPVTGYLTLFGFYWNLALVPLLLLAWLGAKRYPVLAWMAVVHLLFHSLIGHKEYRFVLLTAALLVILAAIGTADLLRRVPRRRLMIAAAGAMAVWAGGSAALGVGNFRPNWSMEAGLADALDRAGRPAETCGLALYRPRGTVAGSYALYRRATPIYVLTSPAEAARHTPAFDVVLTGPKHKGELPAAYRLEACAPPGFTDAPSCVLRRAGGCIRDPDLRELGDWLAAAGN